MDRDSLLTKLERDVSNIDAGRKGLTMDGREHEGRIFLEKGISGAMASFQEANASRDAQTIVMAELVFRQQELHFCDTADAKARSSVTAAIQDFEGALRSLEVVKDGGLYRIADKTYTIRSDRRIEGCPNDVFHQAVSSNMVRLNNSLKATEISMRDKGLLEQRLANMGTARKVYLEMQQAALGLVEGKPQ